MSGPAPFSQPRFPAEFVERCRRLIRQRQIPRNQFQRAQLVLLLHEYPSLSNVVAGAAVELHANSVRMWRRRWAKEDYSLHDQEGRGCKATFSPSRSGNCQSDRL
jgi:hypothetical protein